MNAVVWKSVGVGSLGLALLAGCGGDAPSPAAGAAKSGAAGGSPALPTVSIASAAPQSPAPQPADEATPEWLVQEMTRLRVAPLPEDKPKAGEKPAAPDPAQDVARMKSATRSRNEQIIRLAEETIVKTHDDAQKLPLFNAAVHHLTESRLQLALMGDEGQIEELAENARVLYEHDPKSEAAAEAAWGLMRYAETQARQNAGGDPEAMREFAKQARLFALSFPHEEQRAIAALDAAGWSCEAHGLRQEATACYSLIVEQYPNKPYTEHAAGALRRFALKGQPLQLAGPTFDGGFVKVESFRGSAVLVAFWTAGSPQFARDLPRLKLLAERHKGAGLAVVGVNLDQDEPTVARFLEAHQIAWPTIFSVDPNHQGWDNPAALHYGMRDVPAYWLVDARGVVVETEIAPDQLETRLKSLLGEKTAQN